MHARVCDPNTHPSSSPLAWWRRPEGTPVSHGAFQAVGRRDRGAWWRGWRRGHLARPARGEPTVSRRAAASRSRAGTLHGRSESGEGGVSGERWGKERPTGGEHPSPFAPRIDTRVRTAQRTARPALTPVLLRLTLLLMTRRAHDADGGGKGSVSRKGPRRGPGSRGGGRRTALPLIIVDDQHRPRRVLRGGRKMRRSKEVAHCVEVPLVHTPCELLVWTQRSVGAPDVRAHVKGNRTRSLPCPSSAAVRRSLRVQAVRQDGVHACAVNRPG